MKARLILFQVGPGLAWQRFHGGHKVSPASLIGFSEPVTVADPETPIPP